MELSASVMVMDGSRDRDLHTVFNLFDGRENGYVRTSELKVMLQSLGVGDEYLEAEILRSMRAAMDPRNTGSVDFERFAAIAGPCIPEPGSFEEQFRVFRMMDRGRKGYISLEDIEHFSRVENGGMLTPSACAHIVNSLRGTTRPGLTFDEFKRNVTAMIVLQRLR